jgi:hypothetical protein
LGQLVGRGVIAGLCVAAAAAISALVQGDIGDDIHWRVMATSLGFSLFTALAGSGDALRRHARDWRAGVGILTTGVSALAFVTLVITVWNEDSDTLWQIFGVSGLSALCLSHASLVLRGHGPSDTALLTALVWISIACMTFDTMVANLGIAGVFDDVSDGFLRFLGVVLVVMLLTSALPPLIRRLSRAPAPADAFGHREHPSVADEIVAVARRLEQAPADPRREAAALRELAERVR